MKPNKTLLPGLDKQLELLKNNLLPKIDNALVIGSSSESIAEHFHINLSCNKVELIVEDYESLMNSRLVLGKYSKINISLMNFEATDFDASMFDLVYAQASISLTNRNKIVKEINRVLKPEGFLCVGEVITLTKDYPRFMHDIFNSSNLLPLFIEELDKYYEERKFSVVVRQDLTSTLHDYYMKSLTQLREAKVNLADSEKSYYKKILNKISHESNAYLKMNGDKYLGFVALLLQKGVN